MAILAMVSSEIWRAIRKLAMEARMSLGKRYTEKMALLDFAAKRQDLPKTRFGRSALRCGFPDEEAHA